MGEWADDTIHFARKTGASVCLPLRGTPQRPDFVITNLTPGITSLQPGGDLGFRIRFKPTAAGDRHALLRIHSDAAGSPHTLTLIGVGLAPP